MTAYVALLRGIGPVTHKAMPLGELAAACGKMGLGEMVSVGNTGNLVFRSGESQAAVEAMVTDAVKGFGLGLEVFTRTARQIQMLVGVAPFPDAAAGWPSQMGVCFFHKDPSWPAAYLGFGGPERMRMFSSHLIIDYGAQISLSKLTIEKSVGARMTQRNWNSVLTIAGRLAAL
ncbi:MAG: DUF1697 domain-containing protein [Devosia sp.]